MKNAGTISDYSLVELSGYKRLSLTAEDKDHCGRPVRIPVLPLNHQVVARVDYGDTSESEFFICDSVEDMQEVHACGSMMKTPIMVEWYSKAS